MIGGGVEADDAPMMMGGRGRPHDEWGGGVEADDALMMIAGLESPWPLCASSCGRTTERQRLAR